MINNSNMSKQQIKINNALMHSKPQCTAKNYVSCFIIITINIKPVNMYNISD